MLLRRLLRRLLEPARDPLSDSLDVSLGRVAALRASLERQITGLRARSSCFSDPALEVQLHQLETEHLQLVEVERRVSGEMDVHRARRELLGARQTAAQAQDRLQDLMIALDDAHSRAAALAETILDPASNAPPRRDGGE